MPSSLTMNKSLRINDNLRSNFVLRRSLNLMYSRQYCFPGGSTKTIFVCLNQVLENDLCELYVYVTSYFGSLNGLEIFDTL